MKKLLFFLMCGSVLSSDAKDYAGCFIPGESVEYKVSWAGLPIAWSRTTTEAITEEGRELIRIRMISQTYKAYLHIYKVDDATEIVIDPHTGLPLRLDFVLNEGSIHKSHLITFDHEQKTAIFQDRISMDIRELSIEPDTRDIYSFIYSARNEDLAALGGKTHRILSEGKMYNLGLKIMGDENVKLSDYGKVPCVEIEPIAEFDGIFLRQGKITFCISKDSRRLITAIQAKVAIGKISVKLQKVSGPGDDFWVAHKEQ